MTVSLWLQELADAVAAQMNLIKDPCPIGCHFCEVDGMWEVSLFASSTEIVGGSNDGKCKQSPFIMNVATILPLFDSVESVQWQSQPVDRKDELGAHLAIEGTVEGHPVSLRVLAKAPRRFASGRQVRVHENAVVRRW